MVNPIRGQNPWLAVQSAAQPSPPVSPFDPAQLLDQAQTAAGDASASLYGQPSGSPGDLLGSDISTADPTVAAAMAALQGLSATPSPSALQMPAALPAMGADAITSYLAAAGSASDSESSSDSDSGTGTDIYV